MLLDCSNNPSRYLYVVVLMNYEHEHEHEEGILRGYRRGRKPLRKKRGNGLFLAATQVLDCMRLALSQISAELEGPFIIGLAYPASVGQYSG